MALNKLLRKVAGAVAAVCLMTGVFAQTAYPTKPVKIIVPYSAGGPADIYARFIGDRLQKTLVQPFVIENRPGAGAIIGTEVVAKSSPDGYTLLMMSNTHTVNESLFTKKPYNLMRDLAPISPINYSELLLVVHPSVPANNLKELIELARRQPDKLSYASAGSGSITHLASELFLDMAKVKIVHIPYKGTGPALNDTIAGSTQLIFGSVSTTLQFIKSGRLRGLAVTTPRRISALPDLPTVAEAGVPGYEVVLWHGLVAPKGVPRPIVDRLNREANEVLKAKDMGDLLATDGVAPAGGTPEQFRAVIKADIERWRGVVKQANIKVD